MRQSQSPKPIFPIGLLLDGRPALIVGGGRTALHKARLLLQAGARVNVVAPDVSPEIEELERAAALRCMPRVFQPDDVLGMAIAYAATDDRAVNQEVLRACRDHHVHCCCVDRNWPDSDFITPATFRKQGLVVTVSTGGRSCRHSRLVKDTLERHMQLLEDTSLLVVGTSHHVLPVDEREAFHLSSERLHEVGNLLAQIWGIHDFLVLNTCNRVEVIAAVADQPQVTALIGMILGFDRLNPEQYYVKRGMAAFEHTAMLCAGLLSQATGEKHIVAQVKDALDTATDQGWAGSIMQEWVDSALHVSKHLRKVTPGSDSPREIEDLALHFLRAECPCLGQPPVLVVGAGVVGRGLVSRLLDSGVACIWCFHRNRPDLPAAWEGRVTLAPFGELRARLSEATVAVFAAGGGAPLLAAPERGVSGVPRALTLLDLGMPRNIAAGALADAEWVRYVDLDALKQWHGSEGAKADSLSEVSRAIVHDHADLFEKLIRSIQSGNAVQHAGADSDARRRCRVAVDSA